MEDILSVYQPSIGGPQKASCRKSHLSSDPETRPDERDGCEVDDMFQVQGATEKKVQVQVPTTSSKCLESGTVRYGGAGEVGVATERGGWKN